MNKFEIQEKVINEDDAILVYFDKIPVEICKKVVNQIKQKFPNNKVIALPNETRLEVLSKNKTISILEEILIKLKEVK